MIDLHTHTKYSDGSNTLTEILTIAENAKVEVLAITDHDSVGAHLELKKIDYKKYFSGRIISGVEIKATYLGTTIEILGFGIDVEIINKSKNMVNQIEPNFQKSTLSELKKVGKSIGLKFNEEIEIDEKNLYGCDIFEREIFKYPENIKIIKKYNLGDGDFAGSFYRHAYSNPASIFYVDETKLLPDAGIIIDEIHTAGGLAFLAHPLLYSFDDKLKAIEKFINNYNIDGLECYYSLFSEDETNSLLNLCYKYKLNITGGTDYHGFLKPNIKIGVGKGNMNITKEMVGNWLNNM